MSFASQNCAFLTSGPAVAATSPFMKCDSLSFYLCWSELQNFQKCLRNILQMLKFDNNFPNSLTIQTMLQTGLSAGECLLKYLNQVAIDNGFLLKKSKVNIHYNDSMCTAGNKKQKVITVKKSFSVNSREKIQLNLDFSEDSHNNRNNNNNSDSCTCHRCCRCVTNCNFNQLPSVSESRKTSMKNVRYDDDKDRNVTPFNKKDKNTAHPTPLVSSKFWFKSQSNIHKNEKLEAIEKKLSQFNLWQHRRPQHTDFEEEDEEEEDDLNSMCKKFSLLSIK